MIPDVPAWQREVAGMLVRLLDGAVVVVPNREALSDLTLTQNYSTVSRLTDEDSE